MYHTLVAMSALGQKQTCTMQNAMSALPPKADMCGALAHVRFVPIADIGMEVWTLREQLLERPAERRALLPLPVRPADQMKAHLSRWALN